MIQKLISFIRSKGLDREEFRYIIVGGLTTLVNYSVFTLMYMIMGIDDTFSNVVSISLSILFAYVTNKHFVFRNRCSSLSELLTEFVKFVGSRLFTMTVEVGAVLLFSKVLNINAMIGKAVSQVIVVILNYIISKFLVFRRSK